MSGWCVYILEFLFNFFGHTLLHGYNLFFNLTMVFGDHLLQNLSLSIHGWWCLEFVLQLKTVGKLMLSLVVRWLYWCDDFECCVKLCGA